MNRTFAAAASAIVALLSANPAAATSWTQGIEMPDLVFNGFGTVGLLYSDEDQADFVADPLMPKGAGFSSDWTARVDSRLGLQLTAKITSRITGVGQIIVEQRPDGSFKPTVEWANAALALTPDLTVRAGRVVLPPFMASGHRKVGYANPWVRPPVEVYALAPTTNFDGADINYRVRFQDLTNTLYVSIGGSDDDLADGNEINVRDGLLVANNLEFGATTLFASVSRSRLTLDSARPLFDAFRAFGPEGEAIADRYDVDNTPFNLLSFGLRHDPGDWFVMGEWARTNSRTFFGDSRAWYATGGYRIGDFTPYVTLAERRVTSETSSPGVDAPEAQGLNAVLNDLLSNAPRQKSIAVGTRWDFARSVALKLQVDYLDFGSGSPGVMVNTQPDFQRGGNVSLFSATIDFVF